MRSQQALIRSRRAEAQTCMQEALTCRAAADSAAILGTHERELGNRCRDLLEQDEAKQREAHREGSR